MLRATPLRNKGWPGLPAKQHSRGDCKGASWASPGHAEPDTGAILREQDVDCGNTETKEDVLDHTLMYF